MRVWTEGTYSEWGLHQNLAGKRESGSQFGVQMSAAASENDFAVMDSEW